TGVAAFPSTKQIPRRQRAKLGKGMVRRGQKEVENAAAEANPESEERKRRKRLAFSKGILSEAPAKAFMPLSPSKTVAKHHGKDILRKSQRKNRFLFSFPGLLAPISGGKIGELKDLGTKNPVLYLDFPQGQMKLFGTVIYPKNKYLTLQFSRGGKNVVCEDYLDTMIVFSDAWWIGRKDENPEEACLDFPSELYEAHHVEYDFKGGAGSASELRQGVNKSGLKYVELQDSPKIELDVDSSNSPNKLEDLLDVSLVRHSERTAGKRFNFAEASSGDDSVVNDDDTSEEADNKGSMEHLIRDYASGENENSRNAIFEIDNEVAAMPKEPSYRNHTSLIQTTISTLFKKVEEKNPNSVEPSKLYLRKTINTTPSTTTPPVNGKQSRVSASKLAVPITSSEVQDDDIEEFSSASKETDESDEEWAG
ncbi:hypothetical protein U1Q18_007400, partial [Sarracenia purpurea var. burkii]